MSNISLKSKCEFKQNVNQQDLSIIKSEEYDDKLSKKWKINEKLKIGKQNCPVT